MKLIIKTYLSRHFPRDYWMCCYPLMAEQRGIKHRITLFHLIHGSSRFEDIAARTVQLLMLSL